ncbi:hypothetical protein WA1_18390 [Scytonema hofmannii PCC 7110]|uniref:GrpB family protein n=1 Tax=Scytonema hofmannii PCC 7110 TaxID=128403 RepID=A0A139XBC2_9CYAN|nr:GrpB family protein [Scytonema hofmannii]KYC41985.1 hypothetical protein WA1_18390 [Scytonema hofmannii PCC 7110]
MRNIVVVPYDPNWSDRFKSESCQISAIFRDVFVEIHHVGSTSVPGLRAKPIIDMLLLVTNIWEVDRYNDEMITLGYEPKGEFGISGRRFFVKGGDASRTHHLHTYELDNPEVRKHIDFRDFLIHHPEEAQRYGDLKNELALLYRNDIESYMAGKAPLIKQLLQKAEAWRKFNSDQ